MTAGHALLPIFPIPAPRSAHVLPLYKNMLYELMKRKCLQHRWLEGIFRGWERSSHRYVCI